MIRPLCPAHSSSRPTYPGNVLLLLEWNVPLSFCEHLHRCNAQSYHCRQQAETVCFSNVRCIRRRAGRVFLLGCDSSSTSCWDWSDLNRLLRTLDLYITSVHEHWFRLSFICTLPPQFIYQFSHYCAPLSHFNQIPMRSRYFQHKDKELPLCTLWNTNNDRRICITPHTEPTRFMCFSARGLQPCVCVCGRLK